ncbi:hypothetical protein [Paucibacter soli]|uniref:hypothetical protein n=1 Tax=Paucibacter soli TaxID=3133433 RepID=UPI00309CCD28
MQRTYREWRRTALSLTGDLTDSQRTELKTALQAGRPVTINDTLLKIDSDSAFVTDGNADGKFVHAQNHQGLVCAPSATACTTGLDNAIRWAEDQLSDPDH